MFAQRLEQEDASPLPHHEAVPVLVERAAGGARVVVSLGQGPHDHEARQADGAHRRFAATREDDIGIVVLDGAEGLADGVVAGGAGGGDAERGALGAIADGDLAAREVGERPRDEEG
jgi:hypothetical protein